MDQNGNLEPYHLLYQLFKLIILNIYMYVGVYIEYSNNFTMIAGLCRI